jgi:hypothetical protein
MARKSILIGEEYHGILLKLAKESGAKSVMDYTQDMIWYFKETRTDPKSKVKSASDQVKIMKNSIMDFLKEQENKKVNPLISDLNETTKTLQQYIQDSLKKSDLQLLLDEINSFKSSKSPVPSDKKEDSKILSPYNPIEEQFRELTHKYTRLKNLVTSFMSNFRKAVFSNDMTIEQNKYKEFVEFFKNA